MSIDDPAPIVLATRTWRRALALTVVGLAVLSRLPGLLSARLYNVDEAYLAAMGLTMGQGGKLYHDAVDRKPPLLPWLYSLSERLFGTIDLRLLRTFAALAVAGAGFVVALLVIRLGGTRTGAWAAAVLLVLGTVAFPPGDGQAANFELFALLPAAAAVLLAVMARTVPDRRRLLLFVASGACLGIAGMIKQPFFAILAPVAWEVWRGRARVWAGWAVVVGTGLAVFVAALPFGVAEVWRWAWVETSDYLDGEVGGIRVVGVLLVVLGGFAAVHLPVVMSVWEGRTRLRSVDRVVWWWLAGAVVAVIPGFHFIAHYFELLVPPLALLAGLLLSGAPARARHQVLAVAAVIAAGCTIWAGLPVSDAGRVGPDLVAEVQRLSSGGDRVLVWGALPELYWRTERLPGARFLSVGYVTGKWADRSTVPRDAEHSAPWASRWELFDADLHAHPPRVVIDMTPSGLDEWQAYGPMSYSFGRVLSSCYRRTDDVARMAIWELVDAGCVETMTAPP